jgi:ABC-type branched-subunit amino acid transport system permease subunit
MPVATGTNIAQAPSVTIASYPEYAGAQRAVDYLSDQGFPVENTSIVGTGLRLVEQVLGRMTTGKAALAGLGSGAWFGLFIGLLLGLFTVGSWLAVVLAAVLIGAVWGAIFGAIAHAATRGQRDFSSASRLQASEYAVNVTEPFAEQARQLLSRMHWTQANVNPR